MFNVVLVLFFATSTFSINSMEIVKKKDKKEGKIIKSASFPKTSSKKITTTITPTIALPELSFVIAVKSNNQEAVNNFLSNPFFNPNFYRHTPALHAWTETKDDRLLTILLQDPRVNSCIKNSNNQTAHDLLKQSRLKESHELLKEKMYKWQMLLFARVTLDCTTDTCCKNLKTAHLQGQITEQIILETIDIIKKKIEKTEDLQKLNNQNNADEDNKQETGELPKEACFPEYATKEFMIKKIQFILSLFDYELMDEAKNI